MVTSAEDCLRFSHTSAFVQKFPNIKMVRDKSDLRRTGTSRLAAAAPELKRRFPDAKFHKHHDYVELGGRRFDAFDFAASAADLNGQLFDVENACSRNPDYEEAESVFVRVGDVVIFGYRKKQARGPAVEDGVAGFDVAESSSNRASGLGNRGGFTRGRGGKRTLSGVDTVSAGGVRIFNGNNRHE
jgi:hypothetical protein